MSTVVPLASKLHGKSYYESILSAFESRLREAGVQVAPVATSQSELPENISGGVVLLLLTGGTSTLAVSAASKALGAVIIAHSAHNSLPSALSAKAAIESRGGTAILEYVDTPEELDAGRVARYLKSSDAALKIKKLRIAFLDSDQQHDKASFFESKFGVRVEPISRSRISKLMDKAVKTVEPKNVVPENIAEKFDESHLRQTVAVYVALKEALDSGGFRHGIIDCFSFLEKYGVTPCLALSLLNSSGYVVACEADLYSFIMMYFSQEVVEQPGWIANPAAVKNDKLVLAHCTAPLSLARAASLMPHFESGLPVAVSATLRRGIYTMARASLDLTRVAASRVVLENSGFLSGDMCRTQAELRLLDTTSHRFLEKSLGNHHVLIPGDVRKELRLFVSMLGMSYEEY